MTPIFGASDVRRISDPRYAPIPARIYLGVARLDQTNPSTTLASVGIMRGLQLRSAQNDHLGAAVDFPADWSTYQVEVTWCVMTATAGNACLRIDYGALTTGLTLTASITAATKGAFTAGGQWVVVNSLVATNVAVDPAAPNLVRLIRLGSDGTDTLAATIGVIGLMLTKVS